MKNKGGMKILWLSSQKPQNAQITMLKDKFGDDIEIVQKETSRNIYIGKNVSDAITVLPVGNDSVTIVKFREEI